MGLFFNKQIFILNLPENLTALAEKPSAIYQWIK